MKTEELVELAKHCTRRNFNSYTSCNDCPYENNVLCQDMLLLDVAQRLDKAYKDLKDLSCCYNCRNSRKCFAKRYDTEYCLNGEWEWEGDKE